MEYEDITYNLNSKALLIAVYYELDEIEVLLSLMDTYSKYIRRTRSITPGRKRSFLNYLKYTKKLLSTSLKDQSALVNLRTEVEKAPELVNKSWLLTKISELRGKPQIPV